MTPTSDVSPILLLTSPFSFQALKSCSCFTDGKNLQLVSASNVMLGTTELEIPTLPEIENLLKDFKSKSLKNWRSKVKKMLKIMMCSGLSKSTTVTVHIDDLELLLNGLEYFPTELQLMEMAREVRFSNSHMTWDICEEIHIDDFCQMLQHYIKWIPHQNTFTNKDNQDSYVEQESKD